MTNGGLLYDDTDSDKVCGLGYSRTFNPARQRCLSIESATLNESTPMSRQQKNWLTDSVNSNTYFKRAVPLMGYCFDFSDMLKRYFVKQYGHIAKYYAVDKTALRTFLCGRIDEIIDNRLKERLCCTITEKEANRLCF